MKVLILSWEFPPYITGGLGRHVAELAPALAKQGVTVHVLTPYPAQVQGSERVYPNLIVHRVDISMVNPEADIHTQASHGNSLLCEAADNLWQRMGGFDLIHAHDWLVAFAALTLKQRYKCPVVATIHATEMGRWRNNTPPDALPQAIDQVEHMLTFEAWRVIACSYYMINELRDHFHLPSDKMDMIPNGINLASELQFDDEDLISFKNTFSAADTPLIFSIGRLVYEKGHHVLIGAMPEVLSVFPNAKLILAGKGPLLGHLHNIVRDLGIENSVHFAGFITDVERNKFLSIADCAVFSSLYEPFGIVALEAMVFNCPVIVSNLGGLAEVVDHEKTGLLIYPDNSNSAAWGILQVLENPSLAKQYAANARQMLVEKYDWLHIAGQTKQIYDRVVAERAETDW